MTKNEKVYSIEARVFIICGAFKDATLDRDTLQCVCNGANVTVRIEKP
jgi:hypothetical protein